MKIRFLTYVSGLHYFHSSGEVADLEQEEAMRFVRSGQAEAVAPLVETAALKPPEAAVRLPATRRPARTRP